MPALAATVGDDSAQGCLAALRAAVDLYRRLRGDAAALERRAGAAAASLACLDEIEARVGTP